MAREISPKGRLLTLLKKDVAPELFRFTRRDIQQFLFVRSSDEDSRDLPVERGKRQSERAEG